MPSGTKAFTLIFFMKSTGMRNTSALPPDGVPQSPRLPISAGSIWPVLMHPLIGLSCFVRSVGSAHTELVAASSIVAPGVGNFDGDAVGYLDGRGVG